MLLAALTCFGLGILPSVFIDWMDIIAEQLIGTTIASSAGRYGWMWLTPVSYERASYSGFIVFVGIILVLGIAYALLHVRPGTIRGCRLGLAASRRSIRGCNTMRPPSRCRYEDIRVSLQYQGACGTGPTGRSQAFPKKYSITSVYETVCGDGSISRSSKQVSGCRASRKAPAGTHPAYLIIRS